MPSKLTRNLLLLLAALFAYAYQPTSHRLLTLGLLRPSSSIHNIHGLTTPTTIPYTKHCEDLHVDERSGLLFTACEGEASDREGWFPPMGVFDRPPGAEVTGEKTGGLFVIDPKTFKSTRLTLIDFQGPFVTHGIDIFPSPSDPNSIYIYAVNHLPSSHNSTTGSTPRAASQIEIFHHVLHTPTATHLRSISHPLIRTPNDVLALTPGEVYVTNDHYYREHGLKRSFEDVWMGDWGRMTETVYIAFDLPPHGHHDDDHDDDTAQVDKPARKPTSDEGVTGSIATDKIHGNNGLGRGPPGSSQIIINDASGGVIHLATYPSTPHLRSTSRIKINESIEMDTTIDNPSYFLDPYPEVECDASGYIIAGLLRAVDYSPQFKDPQLTSPCIIHHISLLPSPLATSSGTSWSRQILFQDDGHVLSTAATGVVLAIPPQENGGKKEAWIWGTGPSSRAVVGSKISLSGICEAHKVEQD